MASTERKTNQIIRKKENNEDLEIEINEIKEEESLNDEEIVNLFQNLKLDSKDLPSLINDFTKFNHHFKYLKKIGLFLTPENFNTLRKINEIDNIKILMILSQIYMNIMKNESLYSNYLLTLNDEKTGIVLQIVDECAALIEKLAGFVFDQDFFNFKLKTYEFIKSLYCNCKNKISNDIYLKKLLDFLDSVPYDLFSDAYNELTYDKKLYEVWKSKNKECITSFEDKFSQINNYYEQYEAFRKFVQCNSADIPFASVGGEEEKKEEEKKEIDSNQVDFYHQYGLLILKFCKYHQYIFLNKENQEEQIIEKKDGQEVNEKTRVVFLLDKIKFDEEEKKEEKIEKVGEIIEEDKKDEEKKKEKKKEKDDDNKKIENLMNEKLFVSETDSGDYKDLIKKEINNYLKTTQPLENEPKIKKIREQMSYFLSILDVESYVPLYLTDFSKISISDNFTPTYLVNVPSGKTIDFYLQTKNNETMLIFIEFYLEDKTKDITFEVNKYELFSNSFKPIFKEEKINDRFKFFILCGEYSLYQIVFNNHYSWFTSKDVHYRIALLRLVDKPKKDIIVGQNDFGEKKEDNNEDNEDKNDEEDENKFKCLLNGKKMNLNFSEINQKIEDFDKNENENIINIPVIFYLNNLRIVSKDKGQIKFIENFEEDENFIPKHTFEFHIINYLKKILKLKQAEAKNKKIILSIFSQNRDLSALYKEIEDQIKALNISTINNSINDNETVNYLQKIGFYPGEIIDGYKFEYKLYDLCEQSLIYHLYLSNLNKIPLKKSVLFMEFDKLVVNAAIFNEGTIFSKLKGKKEKDAKWKSSYFNNIKTSDVNGILDLLENANDTFEGIDLVLSYMDCDEEKKKEVLELFDTIKQHCQEKINPPIKVIVYEPDEMVNKVFNYMNLFYNK